MPYASPLLSVVIPAYQEERRIGPTLEELSSFFHSRGDGAVEVIIVSGGSTDDTVAIARQYQNRLGAQLRVLDLPDALGKGAAVRAGVLEAAGKFVIFTDADLAYEPKLFNDFVARLESGADIVIAQRRNNTQYGGMGRRCIASLSRFVFQHFITPGIGDTQAGLKAFTHAAAKDLFADQKINGLLFDVEILMLAHQRKYRVVKECVDWQDKPGSTIRLMRDSARAVLDLTKLFWRIRLRQ